MPEQRRPTEALARLRRGEGRADQATQARMIIHAVEGMAASWHKIQRGAGTSSPEHEEFQKGRQQMAVQGIALLLGVSHSKVREALEKRLI